MHMHNPSGLCGATPWWFPGLWVGDISVLLGPVWSRALASLWVRHLVSGASGPGCDVTLICPLLPSHLSLLPTALCLVTSDTWDTHPVSPRCSSLPAPCLEIPKTCSLHLLNFVALCLGVEPGWEAPSSCSSWFYSFPLSPPVTNGDLGDEGGRVCSSRAPATCSPQGSARAGRAGCQPRQAARCGGCLGPAASSLTDLPCVPHSCLRPWPLPIGLLRMRARVAQG